jgi:hypothetical protein
MFEPLQYRQLDGSTFTFKRNALIQRLVDITSRHQDRSIHALLVSKNMIDTGREGILYNFSRIQVCGTGLHLCARSGGGGQLARTT